jgi:hypothetical protein
VSEIYDSWADDGREVDPGELPVRLSALRDNEEPELPTKGQARQRRMDKMQRELNEIQSFVNDCDRYADAVRDVSLVGQEVRILMSARLAKLRRRAVERGQQIHGELQFLRSQTS